MLCIQDSKVSQASVPLADGGKHTPCRPACYKAYGSSKEDAPACDVPGFEGTPMELLRHVSFVDCPGHDILMATMLNGAAVMDGAFLLIAANEACPQPQTSGETVSLPSIWCVHAA